MRVSEPNFDGMDLLGGGGCTPPQPWQGGVPFFLIKKKKLQIIDSNLNNTTNT